MSETIIFRDLPATFPEKDKYQKPSVASSLVFHALLITALIVFPLLFPGTIEEWQLKTFLVAPLPPPPAAPPAPVELVAAAPVAPKVERVIPLEPSALVSPITIPKDIARIVEEPVTDVVGVLGGVPGGVPGGVAGGILGGILAANAKSDVVLPPPPPPPPPPVPPAFVSLGPIRVGGNVREPEILKLVPPVYPALALKARVTGIVILEATLTDQGVVDNIKVVSGHPLLVQAAIDCVKQWVYEPTYLNGQAVSVVLTAKVLFSPRPTS
jgi:protein TonB